MMRSMYAGVSGLKAHQTRMDVVGNNIANVNTTGYKASRTTFKEMISQTLQGAKAPQDNRGGMNPQQVGLGVMLGSIDTNQTQGNLQSTGIGTDLAIDGNGYFVVNDGSQNYYTRAGNLTTDEDGNLVNSSTGYIMQGWMADNNGNINTSGQLEGLSIPFGTTISPQASENAYFQGNFDSNAPGGAEWAATITVLDSLGAEHTVTVSFQRQLTGNPSGSVDLGGGSWTLSANAATADPDLNGITFAFGADTDAAAAYSYDPDSKVFTFTGDWDGSGAGAPTLADLQTLVNGEFTGITLNDGGGFVAADLADAESFVMSAPAANQWDYTVGISDGTITSGDTGSISFNPNGTISTGATSNITFDPTGGAAAGQEVTLDFSAVKQNAASSDEDDNTNNSSVERLMADGYTMGSLESYSINSAGVVVGSFTNGLKRELGQIAIGSFTNPAGLTRQGDTLYSVSQNSGMAQIGTANTSGRGKIVAGNLEMSNVDLAEQFTDMITTQRGFQANSKIITTTDEMLQELVNLKR
ncbi:MAG: flagellar hook protein FlgE [Firmicutes bacterium]|nr:flagellar hook protein FlgE [Bacillota bacterium]